MQVYLRVGHKDSRPLVYATSWWDASTVDSFLRDRSQPIWVSLTQQHMELYREIQSVDVGFNHELERCALCNKCKSLAKQACGDEAIPLTLTSQNV